MSAQLTLDLTREPALGRDDFLITDANAMAVVTLNRIESWPRRKMLLLGPDGSGKTHLATIWASENKTALIPARVLRTDGIDALVSEGGAVAIEDADRIDPGSGSEQAIFHLWNLCEARNCRILITAREPPCTWHLTLPDLRSRMSAMPVTRIDPPDEALLSAVLVKLFSDRQLNISSELIGWLVPRMDRDLGLARRLVAALDDTAMAEKRNITRDLARTVLAALTDG